MPPKPAARNELGLYIPRNGAEVMHEIHHRCPEVEIRQEQIDALNAIDDNQFDGNDASLVVMAPGLGKTTLMAAHARWTLLREPRSRGVFFNDKNDVINQAKDRFERIVGPEFSYGLFSGDGKEYDELSILFSSFQVMRTWHQAFLPGEFHFGIVDESHHSKAHTYEPVLRHFTFDHLLGVTATPDRMDIHDIRDIYGPEVYNLPLEEAIAKRLLASVDYWVYMDEIAETRQVIDRMGTEYSFKDLDRTIFAPEREDKIVEIIKRRSAELAEVKRLGFCRSIEQAERYAQRFPKAAAFHSGLSRTRQKQLLEQLRTGVLESLFTVDMFNEGVDIPDITQVLFLRNTASKRIFLQQLGRGLRKTGKKSRVQVLDFVDNCDRLLEVDKVWKEVAALAGDNEVLEDDQGVLQIDVNTVHFNESARRTLPLLRAIAAKVYDPRQEVPENAIKQSSLVRMLKATPAVVKALAADLSIAVRIFPRRNGSATPYFSLEEARDIQRNLERLTAAAKEQQRQRRSNT